MTNTLGFLGPRPILEMVISEPVVTAIIQRETEDDSRSWSLVARRVVTQRLMAISTWVTTKGATFTLENGRLVVFTKKDRLGLDDGGTEIGRITRELLVIGTSSVASIGDRVTTVKKDLSVSLSVIIATAVIGDASGDGRFDETLAEVEPLIRTAKGATRTRSLVKRISIFIGVKGEA